MYHYVVGKLTAVHMLVFEKLFLKDGIKILPVIKPIDYAVLRAVIRKGMPDSLFFKLKYRFSMISNDGFDQKTDTFCFFQGVFGHFQEADFPSNFEKCTFLSSHYNCEFLLHPSINLPFSFL